METSLTEAQLADPDTAEAAAVIRACVHYGFCTDGCPTYVLLRDENDSPRGRIDLMRGMLERGEPDAKTVLHLDRCLSCFSCMTTCAVEVNYKRLSDHARIFIERHWRRPLGDRLLRALLAWGMARTGRFKALLALGRLGRPLRTLLPGRLRGMAELAPRATPAPEALGAPGVYPAEGTRRARVALLAGCVQPALAPRINAAAIRLLTRMGCEVVVSGDARCCGALAYHMGKEAPALVDAAACVDTWSAERKGAGLDAVLVTASGCGTVVKDYGHVLRHDPARRETAGAIGGITRDISEYVLSLGLPPAVIEPGWTVAYHDACSLRNGQKVTQPPRELLKKLGFVVRDVPEAHLCCGSAGTYSLLQPDISTELGRRKAERVGSTGAQMAAMGNLGCMTQIGRFEAMPMLHLVELLDWATGGPKPPGLAGIDAPAEPPGSRSEPPPLAIW